jgi:hypothetical protein
MATGRIAPTGKLSATPTRTGVLASEILTGFEIPGLDLTGCTKNYAITLSAIPIGATPEINPATGDVTADGATVADGGVDHEGKDLGAIASVRMLAFIAPSTNGGMVNVVSDIVTGPVAPGGFLVTAIPGGVGGSYIGSAIVFSVEEDGDGLKIISWNA